MPSASAASVTPLIEWLKDLDTSTMAIVLGVVVVAVLSVIAIRQRRTASRRASDKHEPRELPPVLFYPGAQSNGHGKAKPVRRPLATLEVASPPARDAAAAPSVPSFFDGTLQLLPGRLEPLNGNLDQEIRFVKTPGVTRFTFGRSPGPPHTHIQLKAATASRMHAYMTFENGRWRIGNMSDTNCVVVNGTPLPADQSDHVLEDGDRIELGEVAFVFRAR